MMKNLYSQREYRLKGKENGGTNSLTCSSRYINLMELHDMLIIQAPGISEFRLKFLASDFNGTLAVDGKLIPGVASRLRKLSQLLDVHVITADTYGQAREELNGVECSLQIVKGDDQAEQKRAFVERLGALDTVSLGNGNNDMKMLEASGLGIAVIGREGAAISAINNADITVCSVVDGLDLLLKPDRIKATLRVA